MAASRTLPQTMTPVIAYPDSVFLNVDYNVDYLMKGSSVFYRRLPVKRFFLKHLFEHHAAGQGLVEYAMILVLVAVVVIVILSVLGAQIGNIFSSIVDILEKGSNRPCAVTMTASFSNAQFVVPADVLSQAALSTTDFQWTGTGNANLRYKGYTGNPVIASFPAKSWDAANVATARGNCLPFPNK